MFVECVEWINAVRLLRMRLRGGRWSILICIGIAVGLFFSEMPGHISGLLNYYSDSNPGRYDFSSYALLLALFVIIVTGIWDRSINKPLEAFPQTNTSRFLAAQMYNYVLIGIFGLLTQAFNIFAYIIFGRIEATHSNVAILNPFNPGEQVMGLLSWLLFACVFSAFISLILALIEKYRVRVLIAVAALAAYLMAPAFFPFVPSWLQFADMEHKTMPSIGSVLLWVLIWALLVAGAFFVNRGTVYHRTKGRGRAITVVAVVVLAVLMLQSWTILVMVYPERTIPSINARADLLEKNERSETITLKAADIPSGGSAELSMDGIRQDEYGNLMIYDPAHREENPENQLTMSLNMFDGPLEHIGGKEIKIKVIYSSGGSNGYDLLAGTNRKVNAWFEGSVLHLKYTYDTPKRTIILPEWNFGGYGRGGKGGSGHVQIVVAESDES